MKGKIIKYWDEFKFGTKIMFREFFNKKTNKKQRANMWTFSRLISTLFITLFTILSLILNSLPLIYLAGTFALTGAITDFFDGRSARKYNSSSEYGKKLDQVVDKVFGCGIAINLSIINPMYLSILLGETAIAIINVYFKSKHKECDDSSSKLGKIKQWPLFTSLFLGFLSTTNNLMYIISEILCTITVLMQTATSIDYAKKHINKINENNKNKQIFAIKNNIEIKNENNKKILTPKTNSKKEELIKLRNVLLEIKSKKILEENIESKGIQKVIHY